MYTEQLLQALSWPAVDLAPANYTSNTNNTNLASCRYVGPIDCQEFARVVAKLSVATNGSVAANCTVVMQFMSSSSSNTSNTTSWTTIPGGPSVTINSSGSALMGAIEIRADQVAALNTTNPQRYLVALFNNACATIFQGEIFGDNAKQKPASNNNVNTSNFATSICSL